MTSLKIFLSIFHLDVDLVYFLKKIFHNYIYINFIFFLHEITISLLYHFNQ